jgi:hypothetical protein
MVTKNQHAKLFGPSAVFSGYILLVFGIVATYFSFMAIPLVLLGGIMAFSRSETLIDIENKKYKYQLMVFGLLPIGSWEEFLPDDEIVLKHVKGKYYTYSRSNRQSSIPVDKYCVYLTKDGTKKKIILGMYESEKEAIRETNRLMEMIRTIRKQ